MALTTAGAAIDAWLEVAQNTVREGAVTDVSPDYEDVLAIDVALTSAVAHTGSLIRVFVSTAASGDEFWYQHHVFLGPTGTTNLETITNNPLAAGGTSITMASTTGFTTYGENSQWHFLEDATIANSELVLRTAHSADASITIADGVTREHANTAVLNSIAQSYPIALPMSTLRVKIFYDNKYDADGATIATRCRLVRTTGI